MKIRIPNAEIRRKAEVRKPKGREISPSGDPVGFRPSDLLRPSSFGFRICAGCGAGGGMARDEGHDSHSPG